jgi:ActR/RegA family two-component response regulator
MARLLIVGDDACTTLTLGMLRTAGHIVALADSGFHGMRLVEEHMAEVVIADMSLSDMSGLDFLRNLRNKGHDGRVIMTAGYATTRDVVTAMQLGAADYLEKPVGDDALLRAIDARMPAPLGDTGPRASNTVPPIREAHAAARWARHVVAIIEAPADPRTIAAWSRIVYTSPTVLRNCCRMAGLSPRRSLIFARFLRAVHLGRQQKYRPQNLLDVVDQRTLVGLLKLAGVRSPDEFPTSVEHFVERQTIVQDPVMLHEFRRAIAKRVESAPAAHMASRG